MSKWFRHMLRIGLTTLKWSLIQYGILVITPVLLLSMHHNASHFLWIYTAMYAAYWELMPKAKRLKHLYIPYAVYAVVVLLAKLTEGDNVAAKYMLPPFVSCLLYPLYGLACLLFVKWLMSILKGKTWSKKILIVVGLISIDGLITWGWVAYKRSYNITRERTEELSHQKADSESTNIEITVK